jgi:hypothetical protein
MIATKKNSGLSLYLPCSRDIFSNKEKQNRKSKYLKPIKPYKGSPVAQGAKSLVPLLPFTMSLPVLLGMRCSSQMGDYKCSFYGKCT